MLFAIVSPVVVALAFTLGMLAGADAFGRMLYELAYWTLRAVFYIAKVGDGDGRLAGRGARWQRSRSRTLDVSRPKSWTSQSSERSQRRSGSRKSKPTADRKRRDDGR